MLKINCIICGKEIRKPKVDQPYCNRKECRDEFNSNQLELLNYLSERRENGNI